MAPGAFAKSKAERATDSTANSCKFVLVSGGVISGIGKGLTASSIGVLLKSCGYRVTAIKIDPYLNVDAGTMSPAEHGEVFVLNDGGEVDLDLGNYERFLDANLTSANSITTGQVYEAVLQSERKGDFLGKTVQVVPHVTDTIKARIDYAARCIDANTGQAPEICVIELGGTVGDIESMPFVEALRQLQYDIGSDNFCSVFVSLVPSIGESSEQKTKPTQHGVKNLSSQGLAPQMIVCRSASPLHSDVKAKLAMFCQVPLKGVIGVHDVSNTYNIPLMLHAQGVCNLLISTLKLDWKLPLRLEKWKTMAETAENCSFPTVRIAIVGKYSTNTDAYLSIKRALQHATMALGYTLNCELIPSNDLECKRSGANDKEKNANEDEVGEDDDALKSQRAWDKLRAADAVLVPGGFGSRGIEGKLEAISYARKCDVPFLGICLGMQLLTVDIVREVFNEPGANSTEFEVTPSVEAVVLMPEAGTTIKGGTMRLGSRKTLIHDPECMAAWLYGTNVIFERHRHRYEVNPAIVQKIEEESKLRFVGKDVSGKRMGIAELKGHRFFMGTQFHPEFASRPGKPSPIFVGFIMAAAGLKITKEVVAQKLESVHAQNPWSDLKARNDE